MAVGQAAILPFHPICLLISLVMVAIGNNDPQSVDSLEPYAELRTCVQNCFFYDHLGCTADGIADAIGCPFDCDGHALEICYCRGDVQVDVDFYLTSCVSESCTSGGDVLDDLSTAVSLYGSYCRYHGFEAMTNLQSIPATNTEGQLTTTITAQSTTITSLIRTNLYSSIAGTFGTSRSVDESWHSVFLVCAWY